MVKATNTHTMKGYWDDWIILILLAFAFCTWMVPYVERIPWLSGRQGEKKIEDWKRKGKGNGNGKS